MLRTRVMVGPSAGIVLAMVLAAALAAVFSVDLLVSSWRVQAGVPAPVTLRVPFATPRAQFAAAASGMTSYETQWRTSQLVVPRGTVATGEIGTLIEAYEQFRRPVRWRFALGLWSIYLLTGLLMFTYLRRFAQSHGRLLRTHLGLAALVLGLAVFAKALLLFTPLSEYYIPVSVVPLWAALYVDRRAALLLNLALAFLLASFASFDVTLIAVFLARGMGSTLTFRDRKHPRSMVMAGVVGGFCGALMLVACRFFFTGHFNILADLASGYQSALAACVAGGVIAGLVSWLLQEPVGLVLGAVSRSQLVDLADLDNPLLKKMAAEAPGSWQHARAMANLAEDAAAAIGADAMLTRTGAYYHDLGKTIQAKYFVENLEAGERSPHDDLEPDVSADAIMAHVVGGTKILRDAGIPEPVIEFAYTHHGTSVIEFFWHKCQQQGNPKNLTADAFRYPGMRPQTRETAILMLIDSIEAASRTIDPPDHDKFEEMIQRVIFTKLKQGQLDDSGLTVEDVKVLTMSIADTLVKVYHHRIKYPWQRSGAAQQPPQEPVAPAVASSPPSEVAAAIQAAQQTSPAQAETEESESEEGPRASDPPPEPDPPSPR